MLVMRDLRMVSEFPRMVQGGNKREERRGDGFDTPDCRCDSVALLRWNDYEDLLLSLLCFT
jgi:hypothetical protein